VVHRRWLIRDTKCRRGERGPARDRQVCEFELGVSMSEAEVSVGLAPEARGKDWRAAVSDAGGGCGGSRPTPIRAG